MNAKPKTFFQQGNHMTTTPIEPTQAEVWADKLHELSREMEIRFSGEFVENAVNRLHAVAGFLRRTTPAASQHSELAEYGYARRLFESLLKKHYPESHATALPDLMGVLTQIDNLTTGLTRQPPSDAMRNAVIEECAKVAEQWNDLSPHNSRAQAIRALTQGKPDATISARELLRAHLQEASNG
jgi:hypothetical protein